MKLPSTRRFSWYSSLSHCFAASPGWCGRSANHFSIRRKFMNFASSSTTSMIDIVFRQRAHRRHHRKYGAHELSGQHTTIGVDELVDVFRIEASGPDVQKAVVCRSVVHIRMEIYWGNRED